MVLLRGVVIVAIFNFGPLLRHRYRKVLAVFGIRKFALSTSGLQQQTTRQLFCLRPHKINDFWLAE